MVWNSRDMALSQMETLSVEIVGGWLFGMSAQTCQWIKTPIKAILVFKAGNFGDRIRIQVGTCAN